MSHTIIYDTCFVKAGKDRYVPMILAGSNNCYDLTPDGREIRERSWQSYTLNDRNLPLCSEKQILRWVDNLLREAEQKHVTDFLLDEQWYDNEPSPRDNLGYYSGIHLYGKRMHGYADLMNYFKKALKEALPYSLLCEYGCHLQTISYSSDKGFTREESLKTEKELLRTIRAFGNNSDHWLTFSNKYRVEHMRQMQKAQSPGGKNKTYIIGIPQEKNFVKSLIPLQFTQDKDSALKTSLSSVKQLDFFGWIRKLRKDINEITYVSTINTKAKTA